MRLFTDMTAKLVRRDLPAFLMAAAAATPATEGSGPFWDGFPRQNYAWAREVVSAAHTDLAKVKAVVDAHPAAANAAIDWGFGDWETALGAAAHTGRRAIAEYLLEKGARLDLFAATMLGMTDVVKAMVAARPGVEATLGPHGIPLISHARLGGEPAKATLAYLETLPGASKGILTPPLDNERRKAFVGTYQFEGGGPKVEIKLSSPGQLSLVVEKADSRWIHHAGNETFYPAGVPHVRVAFEFKDQKPSLMRITDGPLVWIAKPIG